MEEALTNAIRESPTLVFMAFVFLRMAQLCHRQQRIMLLLLTKLPEANGHVVDQEMAREGEDLF